MVTTPIEKWWNDSFNRMADKWGAFQYPGADMQVPPRYGPPQALTESSSPPPPWTQQPQPQMGGPRALPTQMGPPPQMGGRSEFGLPQKGDFGLPSMGGPQMPQMGPPPQSPNVDGTWPMGAPNNLPGAGQSQKKREMLEHFRRMITARRMAAMNP
jgi:hypothetical protein